MFISDFWIYIITSRTNLPYKIVIIFDFSNYGFGRKVWYFFLIFCLLKRSYVPGRNLYAMKLTSWSACLLLNLNNCVDLISTGWNYTLWFRVIFNWWKINTKEFFFIMCRSFSNWWPREKFLLLFSNLWCIRLSWFHKFKAASLLVRGGFLKFELFWFHILTTLLRLESFKTLKISSEEFLALKWTNFFVLQDPSLFLFLKQTSNCFVIRGVIKSELFYKLTKLSKKIFSIYKSPENLWFNGKRFLKDFLGSINSAIHTSGIS